MTREEAKEILEEVKVLDDSMYQYNPAYLEAIEMAIAALKAEPCEDTISRKHLLSEIDDLMQSPWFNRWKDDGGALHFGYTERKEAVEIVRDLCVKTEPFVTPKPTECEDAVKRQSVLNTLDTMDAALDENRTVEAYKELLKECYKALPLVTPTAKESLVVGDAASREFQELIVEYPPAELCTYPEYRGKPYFSIKYKENGQEFVGYGTYKPDVMSRYLRDYFIKPPVTPKQRMGKWIEFRHEEWANNIYIKCSECGKIYHRDEKEFNFCPNCGAKMEGESE